MKPSNIAPITTGVISSRGAGRTSSGSNTAAEITDRPRLKACDPGGAVTVRSGLDGREVKVRNLPEDFKARVNLFARHGLQTLRAEAFDRKRSHHAAIEHRPAKDRGGQFRLRRK